MKHHQTTWDTLRHHDTYWGTQWHGILCTWNLVRSFFHDINVTSWLKVILWRFNRILHHVATKQTLAVLFNQDLLHILSSLIQHLLASNYWPLKGWLKLTTPTPLQNQPPKQHHALHIISIANFTSNENTYPLTFFIQKWPWMQSQFQLKERSC